MSVMNHISKDYKQTKNGIIPENWELIKLSTYNKSLRSGVSVNSEDKPKKNGEFGILKTSSVSNGSFFPEENKVIIDPKEHQRAKLNPTKNRLLISRMNTPDLVGACAYIYESRDDLFIPDRLWLAEFESSSIETKWLNYLLNSGHYKAQIKNRASGTSNSMKNISKPSFLGLLIPLPPLSEQQKMAEILSTWDQAISTTQKLIGELKLRNKGLAQQLLSGKKRLKGFQKDWQYLRIGDVAIQQSILNKKNEEIEVLSCTKYDGLVRSLDYFGRQVFGEDLSKYKVVPKGSFAYATNHIEEGSIGYQNLMDKGLVSPMYTVFKAKPEINDDFFFRLLKTDRMIYAYQSNTSGSIARRGGLRWNDFSTLQISIPSLQEQGAINSVLLEADKELMLYQKQLGTLKEQKKGLMQKLLTGEIRTI
jgi:type I restriction enzyme S subunit